MKLTNFYSLVALALAISTCTTVPNAKPASASITDPSQRFAALFKIVSDKTDGMNAHVSEQYRLFTQALASHYHRRSISSDGLEKILAAVEFAADKHATQKCNDSHSTPYIIHPFRVAQSILELCEKVSHEIIIAALLHEIVAKTATTLTEIAAHFGPLVAGYVIEVINDPALPNEESKHLQIVYAPYKSPGATLIKLSDILHNLSNLLFTPPTDCTPTQKAEYFAWAEAVVRKLPDVNPDLKPAIGHFITMHNITRP